LQRRPPRRHQVKYDGALRRIPCARLQQRKAVDDPAGAKS